MNNELSTQDESQLAQPNDFVGIAGFENLTPEDFSLPRLILVQLQHVHDGAENNPGAWFRTDTNEHVDNPRILVVGIAKSRAMFDDSEFDRTSSPICRSDDGFFPREEYKGVNIDGFNIPNDCQSCLFSNWEGETPPRCQIADNWAGLTDDAAPVVFRFKGSGYKVSKQLKTTARVAQAKRTPLYIELGSEKQKGDSGVFYTPTFKIVREPVPQDVIEFAHAMNGVNLASRAAEVDNFDQAEPAQDGESVRVYTADDIQRSVETGEPLSGVYTDKDADSAIADELPF